MTVDEIVRDGIKLQEKPTRERCGECDEFYTLCIYHYKGSQTRRIVRCNTCNTSFWINKPKKNAVPTKKSLSFEERMSQKK